MIQAAFLSTLLCSEWRELNTIKMVKYFLQSDRQKSMLVFLIAICSALVISLWKKTKNAVWLCSWKSKILLTCNTFLLENMNYSTVKATNTYWLHTNVISLWAHSLISIQILKICLTSFNITFYVKITFVSSTVTINQLLNLFIYLIFRLSCTFSVWMRLKIICFRFL